MSGKEITFDFGGNNPHVPIPGGDSPTDALEDTFGLLKVLEAASKGKKARDKYEKAADTLKIVED